jgi:hypothetical protein
MKKQEFTTDLLFRSGEFVHILERDLIKKDNLYIFPCQVWFSPKRRRTFVGCALRSQRGGEFGLSEAMLSFALKDHGERIGQTYIALCDGDRNNLNLELINYFTALEVKKLLNGSRPREGKHGMFWWVDQECIPNPQHYFDPPSQNELMNYQW